MQINEESESLITLNCRDELRAVQGEAVRGSGTKFEGLKFAIKELHLEEEWTWGESPLIASEYVYEFDMFSKRTLY